MPQYTLQDLGGIVLATIVFPIIFLCPGYVIGWLLLVFDFRNRLPITRHLIGIVLSNAVSPILLFLLYRFTSAEMALRVLFLFLASYLVLIGKEFVQRVNLSQKLPEEVRKHQRIAMFLVVTGALISIGLLVDIQFQNRLYFSTASYDLTTRVAVVDAITRTGVPPINPGYFPGHPVQLNYLYYFWYILASVVDRLGGEYISAYHAMIASIIWCGISLAATLGVYLKLRNFATGADIRKMVVIALQLILVSGLDFLPVTAFSLVTKTLFGRLPYDGRLEGWDTPAPIMSWVNAIHWVPHHVTAALACLLAILLLIYYKDGSTRQKIISAMLMGCAFASAFGLSVWVMITMAVFWVVWMIATVLRKAERSHVKRMLLAGIVGLMLIFPFIIGILDSTASSDTGVLPVSFYVRPFIASSILGLSSRVLYRIVNLFLLPLNYFFELGLFFVMAIAWLRTYSRSTQDCIAYSTAEVILVTTSTVFLSFFYSTIIVINDLGIRGWLPVQFVLIVWMVDLIYKKMKNKVFVFPSIFNTVTQSSRLNGVLRLMLVIGVLTSALEAVNLRAWSILVDRNMVGFPNDLSPDTNLGERTYSARLAYDFIHDHIPEEMIIQNNPLTVLDRPGGLYGDHQMAIADRTNYGISVGELRRMTEGIGTIFNSPNNSDWKSLDQTCNEFSIDLIIVNDTDPLWSNIETLSIIRPPMYKNTYYAVFACGE